MKVIILSGIPGSGKSTLAKEKFPDYTRISQDDLGDKKLCIKEFVAALEQNKNVVIDRCNHTKDQRSTWINIALQHGAESVDSIYLVVSENEALARVLSRKGHPTISEQMPQEKKMSIINRFARDLDLDPPKLEEGFKSVTYLKNY